GGAPKGGGGLDEGFIVQERERLQRCVGNLAARDARLAAGSVEGLERRVGRGALGERVESPPVAVAALADDPVERTVGTFPGDARDLRREDAGASQPFTEQAACGERQVAEELRLQAERRPAGEPAVL